MLNVEIISPNWSDIESFPAELHSSDPEQQSKHPALPSVGMQALSNMEPPRRRGKMNELRCRGEYQAK